jgi:DNA repair protein RecO (recombination protein O)
MLHKTRGIVLKTTDYSESSVVVQVFTEKFGLQAYLINGVKKPRAKITRNMLQPLHLLDLVVYHKPAGNIQRVAELKNSPVFQQIPYDTLKSCVAIFLNETLYRCIRQHGEDQQLFDYLYYSIELLDRSEGNLANFHLIFLMKLSRYLGFSPPERPGGNEQYFDLQHGTFSRHPVAHPYFISGMLLDQFIALVRCRSAADEPSVKISASERRALLEKILEYYRLHIEGFGEINSHKILEEILS